MDPKYVRFKYSTIVTSDTVLCQLTAVSRGLAGLGNSSKRFPTLQVFLRCVSQLFFGASEILIITKPWVVPLNCSAYHILVQVALNAIESSQGHLVYKLWPNNHSYYWLPGSNLGSSEHFVS